MDPTTDPKVFQFIGEAVLSATDAFVTPTAGHLMESLKVVAASGLTLYLVITGYAVISGAVQSPFWNFMKLFMKVALVSFMALTVDGYTNVVMGSLKQLESILVSGMSGGSSGDIYAALDHSLGKGLELVLTCFERAAEAGIAHIISAAGWLIAGLVVGAGSVMVSILGAGTVIVSKFMLSVMFALGPVFVLALMFPVTAKFFDSWIGQVLNFIITLAIMSLVTAFAVKAFDAFLTPASFSGSSDINPMFAAFQIAALTGVLIWITLQASSVAAGLAGGVSMAALQFRHMLMPVSKAAGAASAVLSPLTARSTQRDLSSGEMVTASGLRHLIAGNTSLNPAYRQAMGQKLRNNWGRKKGGAVDPR